MKLFDKEVFITIVQIVDWLLQRASSVKVDYTTVPMSRMCKGYWRRLNWIVQGCLGSGLTGTMT